MLIYLLSYNNCNKQYMEETTLPVHKQIKIYQEAKTACENMLKHFREVCSGSFFSIQVTEIFNDTGYSNNKVCQINLWD